LKKITEERAKKMKALQEKLQLSEKEVKRFNPVSPLPLDGTETMLAKLFSL